jgi:hypothetical protein
MRSEESNKDERPTTKKEGQALADVIGHLSTLDPEGRARTLRAVLAFFGPMRSVRSVRVGDGGAFSDLMKVKNELVALGCRVADCTHTTRDGGCPIHGLPKLPKGMVRVGDLAQQVRDDYLARERERVGPEGLPKSLPVSRSEEYSNTHPLPELGRYPFRRDGGI